MPHVVIAVKRFRDRQSQFGCVEQGVPSNCRIAARRLGSGLGYPTHRTALVALRRRELDIERGCFQENTSTGRLGVPQDRVFVESVLISALRYSDADTRISEYFASSTYCT